MARRKADFKALDRVGALRAEQRAVSDFCHTLTLEEWSAPSGCSGWSIQDVISHLGATYHGFFRPMWMFGMLRSDAGEAASEPDVSLRRSWAPSQVLAEFDSWRGRFSGLQRIVHSTPWLPFRLKVPLTGLGSYPIGLLTSAMVFDAHTHLRHDIAPLLNRTAPPTDPNRMAVTLEWMLAGLEQMCRDAMRWVDHDLTLVLKGPGGGAWAISPTGNGYLEVRPRAPANSVTTITAVAEDFPVWSTQRRSWRDYEVAIDGDPEYGARFLDAMNII